MLIREAILRLVVDWGGEAALMSGKGGEMCGKTP